MKIAARRSGEKRFSGGTNDLSQHSFRHAAPLVPRHVAVCTHICRGGRLRGLGAETNISFHVCKDPGHVAREAFVSLRERPAEVAPCQERVFELLLRYAV